MMLFGNKREVSSTASAHWEPSLAFFRQGKAIVAMDGTPIPLRWSHQRLHEGNLGFAFVTCDMDAGGVTTEGQGYALSATNAMRQAFAEAWERQWVWRAAGGVVAGVGAVTSSNGFAAGATDEEARVAARGELVERALLLAAWHSRCGWQPRGLTSFAATLWARILKGHGWHLSLFQLDGGPLGSALAGLARHAQLGAVFDTVYLPNSTQRAHCEAKLLRSLLRSTLFTPDAAKAPYALPLIGKPEDHALFYRQPAHMAAFAFLEDPRSALGRLTLPDPSPLALRCKLIFAAGELPAVAAASHPTWAPLTWGQQSIGGLGGDGKEGSNPWPHPLA